MNAGRRRSRKNKSDCPITVTTARELTIEVASGNPELLADRVRTLVAETAKRLGVKEAQIKVVE